MNIQKQQNMTTTKYKKGDKVIIQRNFIGGVNIDSNITKGSEKTGYISKRIKRGIRFEYLIGGIIYNDSEIKGLAK